MCCTRKLNLEGRITVFKSLAVSKDIHLLLITKLHNDTIDILYKIQENFNIVLFATAMKKGYKNVDLRNMIRSMHSSWVKDCFKTFMIAKEYHHFNLGKNVGKNFKFHNNIDINNNMLSKFPCCYQDIFIKRVDNYTSKPTV